MAVMIRCAAVAETWNYSYAIFGLIISAWLLQFLDMLANFQDDRLDDQRCGLPEKVTVPCTCSRNICDVINLV